MNEIEILNLAKEPSHVLSLKQPIIPIDSDKPNGRCPQNSRLNQKLRRVFKPLSSSQSYFWPQNLEDYPAYPAQIKNIADGKLTDEESKAKSPPRPTQENEDIDKRSYFGRFLMRSARLDRKRASFKRMMACLYSPVGCFRK